MMYQFGKYMTFNITIQNLFHMSQVESSNFYQVESSFRISNIYAFINFHLISRSLQLSTHIHSIFYCCSLTWPPINCQSLPIFYF